MAFTLDIVRAELKEKLLSSLVHSRVYDGGVPTLTTLKRENNVIKPYVINLNSTLRKSFGGGSYAGARHDDFYINYDLLSVAAFPGDAEAQQSRIIDQMLGYKPEHAGELNITTGVGGTFTVMDDQQKPVAFVAPISFRLSLDILNTVG